MFDFIKRECRNSHIVSLKTLAGFSSQARKNYAPKIKDISG
jgi:hypothetical protein